MSNIAQTTNACAEFKKEVISGNITAAQKKLDALKVLLSTLHTIYLQRLRINRTT